MMLSRRDVCPSVFLFPILFDQLTGQPEAVSFSKDTAFSHIDYDLKRGVCNGF